MLGALTGDIVGSIYEWNNIKTTQFPLFQGHCRFTDDSVLTVALLARLRVIWMSRSGGLPWSLKVNTYRLQRELDMLQELQVEHQEDGVDVPYERLSPETLLNMVKEFVTREWEEVGDTDFSLEDKVEQVYQQLKERKAKVVFDLASETGNIVVCR